MSPAPLRSGRQVTQVTSQPATGRGCNALAPAARCGPLRREPIAPSRSAQAGGEQMLLSSGLLQSFEGILGGSYPPVPPFWKAPTDSLPHGT